MFIILTDTTSKAVIINAEKIRVIEINQNDPGNSIVIGKGFKLEVLESLSDISRNLRQLGLIKPMDESNIS